MNRSEKRTRIAIILFALFFLLDAVMVVNCMLNYSQDRLTHLASQYRRTIIYYWPRGSILDRNGIPYTNRSDNKFASLHLLVEKSPVAYYVIGSIATNEKDTTSSGAVGTNGLQKAYDEYLRGGSPVRITAPVDAAGNIIGESGYEVFGDHYNEGCTLTTTLDYHAQKSFEEYIESVSKDKGYKGVAVELSEIETGEIIVMASWGDSMNKAVLSYQPGSLMKIITAAAALEAEVVSSDELFTCTGSVVINGVAHYCAGKTAHGELTFEMAFAKSCNTVFYSVAKRLEYTDDDGTVRNALIDLAKNWGFNEFEHPDNLFELEYEGHYSFVSSDIFNDETLFNAALGQGRTQASVYLMNKITAAIAQDGLSTEPHLISSITDPAGNTIPVESKRFFDLNLSEKTIDALRGMMLLTCTDGTASESLSSMEKYGGFAGKTGTAQNSTSIDHAWFSGYFPAENPQYAMTVFIEQGVSSRNALDVYCSLADLFYGLYPEQATDPS